MRIAGTGGPHDGRESTIATAALSDDEAAWAPSGTRDAAASPPTTAATRPYRSNREVPRLFCTSVAVAEVRFMNRV